MNPNAILAGRRRLTRSLPKIEMNDEDAAEGGCGVIGLASEVPIAGRHLFNSLEQMRNRGNGKGGGVAMVGLDPAQFGTTKSVMDESYLVAIAWVNSGHREAVEEKYIHAAFEVDHIHDVPVIKDWTTLSALDVCPPDVTLYWVRPTEDGIAAMFAESGMTPGDFEDLAAIHAEYVFRNTHKLNVEFYAEDGRADAFVLSHGRDMLILKIVGYAEDVIRYYRLEDITAHVWIGHHRYPTRGRVTHPGGAHPFGQGIDVALVHNGDFSNYTSVKDYLGQRGMEPIFFTDTEVAALAFDLHNRVYGYPMEYLIESLAPTSELDFVMLPEEKQQVYEAIQKTHIHGSPDGPWFFIIAQGAGVGHHRLIGITDTSMLRPQVFAFQRGEVGIAFCGSEKQVIDAVLDSLAAEDKRFWRTCDRYWNARGGSYTDGGAFLFDVKKQADGDFELTLTDKFGNIVDTHPAGDHTIMDTAMGSELEWPQSGDVDECPISSGSSTAFTACVDGLQRMDWASARAMLSEINTYSQQVSRTDSIHLLQMLLDRRYPTGSLRRSRWLDLVEDALTAVLLSSCAAPCEKFVGQSGPGHLPSPESDTQAIIVDARPYPIEGQESLARELIALHKAGWKNFHVVLCRGHRFIGNGFGMDTDDVRIDVYGSVGDYLGSGNDGMTIHMHGNGQDQIGQIHKRGTLVVHGDVGQCYGYGAKGGRLFILGNAAGRPMINSVGTPKLVINGSALDYLAESFMAGDPLEGGGFVVINGIEFTDDGQIQALETPYPGGNLFSLSSGGAIYVRDPYRRLSESQLNGGEFVDLSEADWAVLEPLLIENEEHFGIPLASLLSVEGEMLAPAAVYRKIIPLKNKALSVEIAWAAKHD
jgi:glutamate synthase domain-containing protein 1/glutamate synthase domain-containing protein 3